MREFWVSVEEALPEELKKDISQKAHANSSTVAVCSGKDVNLVRGGCRLPPRRLS